MMNRKTIYLDEPIVRINKKLDEVYSHPKTEYATGYADACIAVIKMLNSLEEAQPEQRWIPVTKEEMFKAGYEGREIRFRVDGRLFAIRELAQ